MASNENDGEIMRQTYIEEGSQVPLRLRTAPSRQSFDFGTRRKMASKELNGDISDDSGNIVNIAF